MSKYYIALKLVRQFELSDEWNNETTNHEFFTMLRHYGYKHSVIDSLYEPSSPSINPMGQTYKLVEKIKEFIGENNIHQLHVLEVDGISNMLK